VLGLRFSLEDAPISSRAGDAVGDSSTEGSLTISSVLAGDALNQETAVGCVNIADGVANVGLVGVKGVMVVRKL
jgi:hypothetical protein